MEALFRDIKAYIRYLFESRPLYSMVLITNQTIYTQFYRQRVKAVLVWRVMLKFENKVRDREKLSQLVILLMDYYIVKEAGKYESRIRFNSGRK